MGNFKSDDMPGRGGARTEKMNRSKMITLRLDVDTLAAWKLAAASLNLGVSEMIRTFVAEGLKDREIR